jgi:hypothetical protein
VGAILIELNDPGAREGHQNRRVRREDELRPFRTAVMHDPKELQLTLQGQGRLRLVEHIQAGSREAAQGEVDEGLTMRFAVKVGEHSSDAVDRVVGGDVGRHPVEGLRAQEPAPTRRRAGCDLDMLGERTVRRLGTKPEIAASALRVEAGVDGDSLDDG